MEEEGERNNERKNMKWKDERRGRGKSRRKTE
jgi:hypothetical protein